MRMKYVLAAGFAAGLIVVSVLQASKNGPLLPSVIPEASAHSQRMHPYAELPMTFERNAGQTDSDVRFLARGAGYSLFLTPTEAVLSLHATTVASPSRGQAASEQATSEQTRTAVVRMSLQGAAQAPVLRGEELRAGRSHYFNGAEEREWKRDVEHFGKVRYSGVYPGIDLVYYGNQQQLEYDFIVAPGHDPDQIAMDFDGVDSLSLDAGGNLVLRTTGGVITQNKPVVYQDIAGARLPVEGRYQLLAGNRVGFALGRYDAGHPLIIDPILGYSTFLGGGGNDNVSALALDAAGNLYVAGTTASINFPQRGAVQASNAGVSDAFVSKFNPDGTGLVYSTYLGGGGDDFGIGLDVDAGGNAVVMGHTTSTNFPVKAAIQATHAADGGLQDAYVAKLNAAGNGLVYSTYLGGNAADYGLAMDLDSQGNVYVAGNTSSSNFPFVGVSNFSGTPAAGQDGFLTRLSATGSGPYFSVYLGGNGSDEITGIAVDTGGDIYLTGYTTSDDFPVSSGALQPTLAGAADAFVTQIVGPTQAAPYYELGYSSYMGGGASDYGVDIAVLDNENVIVGGRTRSGTASPFPTTNAAQASLAGGQDGFMAKLDLSGAGSLVYSTYLGGLGDDAVKEVDVDYKGAAYVVGYTNSTDLPGMDPLFGMQHANGGGYDAFVARHSPSGGRLWATYMGGGGDDFGYAIALYGIDSIFVGGSTASANLPTRSPFQKTKAAGNDGFIGRLSVRTLRTLTHDFNLDRVGDVLLRNSTGANSIWLSANSGTQQAVAAVTDTAWQVAAVGDFNGDVRADIVWRNQNTGSNTMWWGGNSANRQNLTAVTAANWKIAGVGDFNGDFKDDLLWRNTATGANAIWRSGSSATQQPIRAVTSLAWQVAGTGDFDGDAYADILWRSSSTGQNVIWFAANSAAQAQIPLVADQAWQVAGIGDFLGDGRSDILWRNVNTGANSIWHGALSSRQQILVTVTTDWSVAAIADYDGDARSDVLWHNGSTGANVIWKSANSANRQLMAPVSTSWNIVK